MPSIASVTTLEPPCTASGRFSSTIANEAGYNPDAIERQLAHKGQGVRAIYNLAKHMPERKKMMQAWADYLDACRALGIDGRLDFKAA